MNASVETRGTRLVLVKYRTKVAKNILATFGAFYNNITLSKTRLCQTLNKFWSFYFRHLVTLVATKCTLDFDLVRAVCYKTF